LLWHRLIQLGTQCRPGAVSLCRCIHGCVALRISYASKPWLSK
jgi:hypothetical protein